MRCRTWRRPALLLCAVLLICTSAVGCGGKDEGDAPSPAVSPSETASAQPETTPGFLAAAQPMDGAENLSTIEADFLSERPYAAALRFGDNLLLIDTYYLEPEDETSDLYGNDMCYDNNFCYQFDLYSLEENAIVASLNTEEQYADYYQIVGTELFLVDDINQLVYRYDQTLSPIGTYDISSFADDAACDFYTSSEENTCYLTDYRSNLQKATFSGTTCTLTPCETDYYCWSISMASPDRSKLLLSTVDRQTTLSEYLIVDTASLSTLRTYSQISAYYESLSDQAFLAMLSYDPELYMCDWFQGDTVYFTDPEDCLINQMMGSYIFASQDTIFSEDEADQCYRARVYDSTGSCVSSMSYPGDTDGDGECDIYFASDPVYFEAYNCCIALVCNLDEGAYLLVWDLSVQGEAADGLSFYSAAEDVPVSIDSESFEDPESDGRTVTEIPDRSSYDWGELAEVRSRADALEDTYGISIYLGPEIPSYVGEYCTSQCLDEDTLSQALDCLEKILTQYPENFFSQLLYNDLQGIRIYLTGTIWGDIDGMIDDPSGYVNTINQHMVMVLDAQQLWNWDYTVNHEISHMIDRKLTFRAEFQEDALFSEETWSAYNPDGFSYLETYDGYEYNWEDDWIYCFIDSYGTTCATEDRAEIFGTVMSDAMNDCLYDERFTGDTVLAEKLQYYCACIRSGFDTTGWSQVMPWEEYIS